MLVREAAVGRVGPQPILLTGQSVGLQLDRPLERLGLESAGELMSVSGGGPFHRVAQEHHQSHPGQLVGNPLGRERVEQVVRLDSPVIGEVPVLWATRRALICNGKWPRYQAAPLS